jgi:phosphoserine phosphatase
MGAKWCAALDFDGTMGDPGAISIFKIVKDGLDVSDVARQWFQELVDKYLEKSRAGEASLREEEEWILTEVEILIREKASPLKVAELLLPLQLRPGVIECLYWLKAHEIPTAVISFGVRPWIQMVLANHGILGLVDEIYALDLTLDPMNGLYNGYDDRTLVLPQSKADWAHIFASKHGVPWSNIIGIGDSVSDRQLGSRPELRFGFAEGDKQALAMCEHFGHVVVGGSFRQVIDWLEGIIS